MKRLALMLGALATLCACASTPLYVPATQAGGLGYSEQRIETDRWRVIYRAGRGADPAIVADFALLRAADLTILSGNDWFVVDRRESETEPGGGGPRVSVGVGGGDYGRHSGVGVGVGVGFPLGSGQTGPSQIMLEMRMGRGTPPAGPNAYMARDVAQSLRGRLGAPPN